MNRRVVFSLGLLALLCGAPSGAQAQIAGPGPGAPGGGDGGGPGIPSAEIECAHFMIRDVRLEGPTQVDLRLWEPVDLIQPNALPSEFDLIDFLPGSYDLVRFTLEPLAGFMPGPSGRKVSTFICGTIDGVYFEYRDDTYDNIEMPRNIPMQVVPGDLELLVAQFDVRAWLVGVDFTLLTPAADGVVYIDEAHHPDVQHAIRQRIKASIDALRGP